MGCIQSCHCELLLSKVGHQLSLPMARKWNDKSLTTTSSLNTESEGDAVDYHDSMVSFALGERAGIWSVDLTEINQELITGRFHSSCTLRLSGTACLQSVEYAFIFHDD